MSHNVIPDSNESGGVMGQMPVLNSSTCERNKSGDHSSLAGERWLRCKERQCGWQGNYSKLFYLGGDVRVVVSVW